MSIYGVAVTKRVSFRNALQEFSNVYHYDGPSVDDPTLSTLLDNIVVNELPIHSAEVSFVHGRVWTAGGTAGSNEMRVDKNLTGTGTGVNDSNMDRERAFLIQWPNGKNSKGRPVYLRKWYHTCGAPIGQVVANGIKQQTQQITSTLLTELLTRCDNFESINAAGSTFTLCSPRGRGPTGAIQVYPWLEHHQLGDMWRG